MINVSELIEDPDFTQVNGINIIRSTYEIINHEPNVVETELNIPGIITINSDTSVDMQDTADSSSEAINVFTYVPLITTSEDSAEENRLADVVVWNSIKYKVVSCMNDSQYGFCKSVARKLRQDVM